MMKKLFITFSTVAILTCSSVNASEKFDINPIHIEIKDDLNNYDENDEQFVEIKHLVSEGSFTKKCFDAIVKVNNWVDQFEENHPYLAKTAECAVILGGLAIIWKALMIAPIKTVSVLSACYVIARKIVQLIAKGQEYIIDSLVEKGYSEEEVTKYVCAFFELGGKLLSVTTLAFAFTPLRGIVAAARANLAKFSKIGVQKAVSKRFSFSYKLQRQWRNLIEGFKHSWNAFRKSLTTPSQQYSFLKNH